MSNYSVRPSILYSFLMKTDQIHKTLFCSKKPSKDLDIQCKVCSIFRINFCLFWSISLLNKLLFYVILFM